MNGEAVTKTNHFYLLVLMKEIERKTAALHDNGTYTHSYIYGAVQEKTGLTQFLTFLQFILQYRCDL